ncbi:MULTISPECIES: ABC transporter substrate-binding protein [unclassified Sinorhizobium]|uniref:ABC transporter substrate-binding protein n=1 Tax=unclassified Sinorhizobium TaxID=2613772 RepID=UPI0035250FE4
MKRVPIAFGGVDYLDRTAALQTGLVSPAGVDLNYIVVPGIGDLFRRVAQHAEFDASEFSASSYFMMLGKGDRRFVAIPVFPSRSFRHSQVYINTKAGITKPEDLAGRNIGILDYQMTAALWIRAFLQHDHGVAPKDVTWWTGGLYTPDFAERMPMSLPPGVELRRIPEHETLEGMLSSGKLDALVTVEPPRPFLAGSPEVARLFPDYRRVEADYFKRTGFFPIMHLVVIRRDVYEANRWVAVSLLQAFEAAKQYAKKRMHYQGAYAVGLPWLNAEMEEVDTLFGGDAFPYGVTRNRAILEQMTVYAHEQGFTPRKLDVEELFAPETYQDDVPG